MALNLIFKSLSSIAILSRNNYYQVSPMYEHSKEVLLAWDLDNKDLNIDAFLNSLYLLLLLLKKGEESDQFWIETSISLESCSFPRAMSHKANEFMSHYA